jgi:hypothetical protein
MTEPVTTLKDLGEINAFFASHQQRGVQIWRYDVSHSWLELVMMHEGQIHWQNSTEKYTAINCLMTHSMVIPTIAWRANLVASERQHGERRETVISLVDEDIGFKVECEHLFLYVGRHPNTPVQNLPNGDRD